MDTGATTARHFAGSAALISSSRVEGTDVYNTEGQHIGTIEHIMLDKVTGQTAYAVMSFGGFLGIGEKYHPLPWQALHYDTEKGGYVVAIDKKT
ncbi:MAG: PRC-barrel domain-containing protein, partial [Rhodospirillaceae bacterium]|nr:PRC-barrel domain-containing protein [Rhodospirillaceae bacterium]